MDIFRQHEAFEIETLDKMNSAKVLEPLVFGGGTMLRLCHELNRYSVALDFWFIKKTPQKKYFDTLKKALEKDYEITDAEIKHYTLLFELRSAEYPKRLKIEIRRELKKCDYQKIIAFSKSSTRQVLVNAHTLEQTMKNKIQAFLDRGEIRDCFDIEFLIRRGVHLPVSSEREFSELQKKITRFKNIDFRVRLGSILEKDIRDYYIENRFSFLEEKLATMISK
ncbi:MAG: nucleotidyl transferase AbiEii/AbiGii toxin family protein [Deltaproteobacteria bacterium]|nr:nucleotidyl transferase AbiEii/AbiGii toxin family protein [Deltaproteobacteria bacterium]